MTIRKQRAIAIARKCYTANTDDIEIDDNPAISTSKADQHDPDLGGVWVAAWVWVSNRDIAQKEDNV